MANILPEGKSQFVDGNGKPYAGGFVYFYIPSTTTPKNTWQDAAQTILNTQPIVLDGDGRAIIFGSGAYRQQLYDVNNNLIWDQLTYSSLAATDLSATGVPGGAGLIGFDGNTLAQQFQNRVERVCTNIAALRAIAKTTYSYAFVEGYYTQGDGGGGSYWYDSTDTTSADNGGTIIVASDGGRWKLASISAPLDIRVFGAKSDGVMDIGGILNTMLGLKIQPLIPYSSTAWIINTTVTIAKNNWIEFEDPSVKINSTATAIFRILGNPNEVIEPCGLRGGAVFDMTGSIAGSSVILMGTSSQNVASVRILGRYMAKNCYSFYLEETSASNFVLDVQIEDVYCQYTKGRQFYSKRSRGFFLVRSFAVDHTANTYVTNWEGIRVEDFIGFEGERLDVVGPIPANLSPVYQSAANSMVFAGVGGGQASLFLTRALADNTYGNGIIIDTVLNVECGMISAYQNLGFGIQINNCTNVQVSRIEVVGAVGVTGASAGQHGLALNNCDQLQLNNVVSNANTSDGVLVHNTTHGVYTNVTTRSNSNIGWAEDGTSNLNVKIGLLSYSNTSSSLVQVGANSATCNWIPNSGTFTSSTVGPATV